MAEVLLERSLHSITFFISSNICGCNICGSNLSGSILSGSNSSGTGPLSGVGVIAYYWEPYGVVVAAHQVSFVTNPG